MPYNNTPIKSWGQQLKFRKKTMLLSDLDQKVREKLLKERAELSTKWHKNTPYEVSFTNLEGTRFFKAVRKQDSWSDDKGNYMPYGGGSRWYISYGKILWATGRDPLGGEKYFWKRTSQLFAKSSNGTVIPKSVATKNEVMDIAKQIGILVI